MSESDAEDAPRGPEFMEVVDDDEEDAPRGPQFAEVVDDDEEEQVASSEEEDEAVVTTPKVVEEEDDDEEEEAVATPIAAEEEVVAAVTPEEAKDDELENSAAEAVKDSGKVEDPNKQLAPTGKRGRDDDEDDENDAVMANKDMVMVDAVTNGHVSPTKRVKDGSVMAVNPDGYVIGVYEGDEAAHTILSQRLRLVAGQKREDVYNLQSLPTKWQAALPSNSSSNNTRDLVGLKASDIESASKRN